MSSGRAQRMDLAQDWVRRCFGNYIAQSKGERSRRLAEEALELAQACGNSKEDMLKLIERVYTKKPGDVFQELGGVSLTLLTVCAAAGFDPDFVEHTEIRRVLSIPDKHWRDRQMQKYEAGVGALPI